MITKIEEFANLMKLSNELAKNNKSLFKENREEYYKLVKFSAKMETNFHIEYKNDYIELLDSFLNDKITVEVFSLSFMAQYETINKILEEIQQNFKTNLDQLANLLIDDANKNNIGMPLAILYDRCATFGLNPDSLIKEEAELKNSAKILLSELKKT